MDKSSRTEKRLRTIRTNMISRCYDEKSKDYKYYGEKGIKVCPAWQKSLASFCVWALLNGYDDSLTLDRKDSSKNYCPENCQWVSMSIQNRNRSQNRIVEIGNKKMCIKDWCRELGLKYEAVMMRIHRGMSEKEALGIHEEINKL